MQGGAASKIGAAFRQEGGDFDTDDVLDILDGDVTGDNYILEDALETLATKDGIAGDNELESLATKGEGGIADELSENLEKMNPQKVPIQYFAFDEALGYDVLKPLDEAATSVDEKKPGRVKKQKTNNTVSEPTRRNIRSMRDKDGLKLSLINNMFKNENMTLMNEDLKDIKKLDGPDQTHVRDYVLGEIRRQRYKADTSNSNIKIAMKWLDITEFA